MNGSAIPVTSHPTASAALASAWEGAYRFSRTPPSSCAQQFSFYGGGIAPALLPRAANLHAPMLFFWGGLDKHIPQDQIRSVIDAVRAAGKPYINVDISDADHGFFCDARPSYNPVAAKEAWSLVTSFLEAHVKKSEERTQSAR
jgi:dienelactone hydrolase